MNRRKVFVILVSVSALCPRIAWGQDTVKKPITLPEINVSDHHGRPSNLTSPTPAQSVSAAEVERLGGTQLSDALRLLAGTTLKDYGGVGGVKTVSVRGLGSQFSTLTIDGIAVNDCQNGQVDLGRYLLGNSSFVTLSNGQGDNMLQSARAIASGSTIALGTREPEGLELAVGSDAGSFGYLSPSLSFGQRIGHKGAVSFWGNHTRCEGDYPYTLYYTADRNGSSSQERRQNSQMAMTTGDLNIFYQFDTERRLHVKTHYMEGFHALPGPVIYYAARGTEHSEEQLFFTQAQYTRRGQRWDWQLQGKYHIANDAYEDSATRTPSGTLRNEYEQREGYLSQAVMYHSDGSHSGDGLTIDLSADESLSRLQSNLPKHNDVQRFSVLGALSAKYRPNLSDMQATLYGHLLGTYIQDSEGGMASEPYARITPYIGATVHRSNLRVKRISMLRYFYKESYRVPNFNELYYFTVGRSLRPERAQQHNIGITHESPTFRIKNDMTMHCFASVDAYYNRVSDKIIATPTQNMYLWSMANVGVVDIVGLDAAFEQRIQGRNVWQLNISYSYQHAVDHSDPESKTYGHQIPYTPRHSGNVSLIAITEWVQIGYSAAIVGPRYRLGQNTEANRLRGYADQGITLSRDFELKYGKISAKAQVLNIFDVQYEVVKNYPMMGRNYRIGLTWSI